MKFRKTLEFLITALVFGAAALPVSDIKLTDGADFYVMTPLRVALTLAFAIGAGTVLPPLFRQAERLRLTDHASSVRRIASSPLRIGICLFLAAIFCPAAARFYLAPSLAVFAAIFAIIQIGVSICVGSIQVDFPWMFKSIAASLFLAFICSGYL